MNGLEEVEYLVTVIKDFIELQPKSVQIAVAEKSQACVNVLLQLLKQEPESNSDKENT